MLCCLEALLHGQWSIDGKPRLRALHILVLHFHIRTSTNDQMSNDFAVAASRAAKRWLWRPSTVNHLNAFVKNELNAENPGPGCYPFQRILYDVLMCHRRREISTKSPEDKGSCGRERQYSDDG